MDIDGKTVFVTGGTGSFGTQFLEHVLRDYSPRQVVVYSRDELKQYEQNVAFADCRLHYVIGDVRDRGRLTTCMAGSDIVVHAAALKQVVAAENNPSECILTNINGVQNVIEAALANGVSRVVALSTDKAVNPVNLYGATKLCGDKLIINANRRSGKTLFAVVRYGNVIGSRGSVIPYFRSLQPTGKLPITDPRMTRFWITLAEGVRFVSRCIRIMQGAEVFVAKIPSMRIVDLASAIAPECEHEFIGIREGEKLNEIMIPADESHNTLEFEDFYLILPAGEAGAQSNRTYEGSGGTPVAEGFRYTSDTNPRWVRAAELAGLIPREAE